MGGSVGMTVRVGIGVGGMVLTNVGEATKVGDGVGTKVCETAMVGDGAGVGCVLPPSRLQSAPVMVAGRRYRVPSHSPTAITTRVLSAKCARRILRLAK